MPEHSIYRVVGFEIAGAYVLRVRFDDGSEQTIDFKPILAGELYGPLHDRRLFEQVCVDPEVHTLVWPNGADFDPETLHDWPRYAGRDPFDGTVVSGQYDWTYHKVRVPWRHNASRSLPTTRYSVPGSIDRRLHPPGSSRNSPRMVLVHNADDTGRDHLLLCDEALARRQQKPTSPQRTNFAFAEAS